MAYSLPKLNYDYNALEPHLDAKTMEIHHTKHHQTYITNLNNALESANIDAPECVCSLIKDLNALPESIRGAVRNNGGGHANHAMFWEQFSASHQSAPVGDLASEITSTFGTLSEMKAQFKKAALTRFGSGWAWLVLKHDGSLAVTSTPNQDSPCMKGMVDVEGAPIIGLDVWEHAYYLNYQNRRPDYVNAFWNILDWKQAETNFQNAKKCMTTA